MPLSECNGTAGTGNEAIDHEHRGLIETVNALCADLNRGGRREPVLDGLGLLYQRSCAHFALEDKLFRNQGHSPSASQKVKCEEQLESVRTMMDAYHNGDCSLCDKALDKCLLSWLDEHLRGEHRLLNIQPAA